MTSLHKSHIAEDERSVGASQSEQVIVQCANTVYAERSSDDAFASAVVVMSRTTGSKNLPQRKGGKGEAE